MNETIFPILKRITEIQDSNVGTSKFYIEETQPMIELLKCK